jgi:thiosulfate/3-mercaptopyruvate sulfurtransferase
MSEAARSAHLIDATTLRVTLSRGSETVVLDVRHVMPADRADHGAYLAGHLPGALFVDVDTDLSGVSTGSNGRRPLPAVADFEKTVRRWGIRADTPVVVYGAAHSPAPARAWWLLRWAGVESVRVLDGGIAAWDGELATGAPIDLRPDSDFVARLGALPVVEVGDIPALADRGLLIDARPAAKFSHPTDPGAGHIPGARSAPVAEFFDGAGFLLPDTQLRERFTTLGVPAGEPAAYCGTGVAAALEVFVLAVLGVPARLYPGSASEWTADPSRGLAR